MFAALEAMIEEVRATGLGHAFEWFFLSDTTDPEIFVAEEQAFLAMRERLGQDLPPILSTSAEERQPQSRKHSGFRHQMGRPLRAYGRARCRQLMTGHRS